MTTKRLVQANQSNGIATKENLFPNGGLELPYIAFVGYDDGSSSRPVNGTGGSATGITLTRSTTTPLSGIASLIWDKDANDRQGKGQSVDWTPPISWAGKVVNLSFVSRLISGVYSSGSPTTDSDLILYAYDVTGSVLIEPVPFKIEASVIDVNNVTSGQIQLPATPSTIRFIIHTATTSNVAYSIRLDDFEISLAEPFVQKVVTTRVESNNNPSITLDTPLQLDVVTYDTTGSWDGVNWRYVATEEGWYDIQGSLQATGATASINLWKNGVSNSQLFYILSTVTLANGSGQIYLLAGDYIDFRPDTTLTQANSGFTTWFVISKRATIVNGDSAVNLTSYTTGAGQSIPNNTNTTILFDTKISNSAGSYDSSTGVWTSAKSQYICVSANVLWSFNAVGIRALKIFKNGAELQSTLTGANTSVETPNGITFSFPVVGGDTVEIQGQQTTGGSLTLFAADIYNSLSIFEINGNQGISSTQKIVAKYRNTTAQALTAATQIDFQTKDIDTLECVTTGASWKFTAPRADYYRISVTTLTDNSANNLFLYVNGSNIEYLALGIDRASGPTYYYVGTSIVYLNSGDFIDVRAESTLGTTNANGTLNYICIESCG